MDTIILITGAAVLAIVFWAANNSCKPENYNPDDHE